MLCVGGGVAANRRLRERLTEEVPSVADVALHIPPLRLCTDNAVMGAIAVERLKAGLIEAARPGRLSGPGATSADR